MPLATVGRFAVAAWLAIAGMIPRTRNLTADESGQDLTEYALLIAFIAVVVIGAVTAFGEDVVVLFSNIVSTLPF
jgi:Flp pilus assembly pilin Flp